MKRFAASSLLESRWIKRFSFGAKMPRIAPAAELQTLMECQYSFPAETLSDLSRVRSIFSDLRLYVDFYCFPNKEKKKLVYLAGTVPVHYQGSEYNIPVCIWLHETHPVSRPRCYVCPSVSMVINPCCPCVDSTGILSLDGLKNWTHGVSNLSLLVSEMRLAFRKVTPLYARCAVDAPPSEGAQVSRSAGSVLNISSDLLLTSTSVQKASEWEQSREVKAGRSYTEELLGIDFSAPSPSSSNNPFVTTSSSGVPPAEPLSRMMGALTLGKESQTNSGGESPLGGVQTQHKTGSVVLVPDSGPAHRAPPVLGTEKQSQPGAEIDYLKMAASLPPDRTKIFLLLMSTEEQSFTVSDVLEAVQLNRDFQSALKFLTHNCPICQEQVSFSKIITMTHCSCFLCQTCFKTFFLSAIKEKSIDQLACPQCGKPEIRGPGQMEVSMDYFNLLDTQIRHFLPPHIHELFQRKLRDQALQEMPNFRWCAHCSFGMLHEADRLRMDCPSCKKSTCSQCRSPWSPHHHGLSCQQFRVWQQDNHPDDHNTPLISYKSIECPRCQCVFSLSKGGCLHFTCSQCRHQFCGGCSQPFTLGSTCDFSADCGTKGLHAHHPRDCLYHLRDWSTARLLLLLQQCRVTATSLEAANGSASDSSHTGTCLVLVLRDDGSRQEEPCGRPALLQQTGYCQVHYKEHLVELINRFQCDPAVLFSLAEMTAELQRWNVAVPTRKSDEPEPLYAHRLRLTVTNSIPLRKQQAPWHRLSSDLCCGTRSSAS